MDEAIRIAIEKGGYRTEGFTSRDCFTAPVLQDSLFWRSLGKALGWKGNRIAQYSLGTENGHPKHHYAIKDEDEWLYHAEEYFHLVLTGGDQEKFWSDILHENSSRPTEGV